ncbi:hypothetical protein ACFTSF_07145 [Kribbella sp. NPDC056951]|uniref:hypothetical protein n=1 Tax=Kribbella sp. NPDC056951 TaxID=3345978 RepID=UPI003632B79F
MTLATSRRKVFARAGFLPLTVLLAAVIGSADASFSDAAGEQAAAASCTLNVPARVHISAPFQSPAVTLGADCAAAGVVDARWEAKRADGVVTNKLFFNFGYGDKWSVYDNASLAPVTWQPAGAYSSPDPAIAGQGRAQSAGTPSPAGNQPAASIPQNSPATDIRMMSKVDAVASEECIAEIWAQRYAIAPHGLINYGGRTGSVQQLNTSSGGWYVIASFTTGDNGHWRGTLPNTWAGTTQSRRVVIYDGQYIFGSISPTYTGEVNDCPASPAASAVPEAGTLGVGSPRVEVSKGDPGPLEPPAGR